MSKIIAKAVTAAVRGNSVLALASADVETLLKADKVYAKINQKQLTALACADCGSHQHSVTASGEQPFCVLCGSEKIGPTGKRVAASTHLKSDSEAIAVKCSACGTHNVYQAKAVTASCGKVHCVACGTKVAVATDMIPDVDGEVGEVGDDFGEELGNGDNGDIDEGIEDLGIDLADGDDVGLDDDDNIEGADADADDFGDADDGLDAEFPEMSSSDDEDDLMTLGSDGEGNAEDEEEEEEDVTSELYDGTDASGGVAPDDSFTEGESFNAEGEQVDSFEDVPPLDEGEPLINTLGMDDTPDNLAFVETSSRVLVMRGCYAIATATTKTAGKNADLIFENSFQTAMVETARKTGLRKSLAQFGFRLIKAPIADTASVERRVVEARLVVANKQASEKKVFSDCMALAAVGLSRGLWKGANNPLRSGFENALEQAGVRNPKRVTAQVFGENGLNYTTVLIEVANKLTKMSTVARKEYADMLDMVDDEQEQIITSSDEMDTDLAEDGEDDLVDLADDVNSVTSRFHQTASLVRAKPQHRDQQVTAHAILAGTAPLKFNV